MAVILYPVEQNTDEWHALRTGRITASNAHILLTRGLNAARNMQSGGNGNRWAQRGHDLEPEALSLYEAVKGVSIKHAGFVTNDDYPECGLSPDGWEPYVEIKCFAEHNHRAAISDMPMSVYAQVQFGMMIGEKEWADVGFYNPDIADSQLVFKVVKVMRDERLIARFERILGYGGKNQKSSPKASA